MVINVSVQYNGGLLPDIILLLKAVVKRKNPRTPAFQPFIKPVSYFSQKQLQAVQCLYQLGATICPQTPLLAARADKAGEGDCSNRQSGAPQGACVGRYIRGLVG